MYTVVQLIKYSIQTNWSFVSGIHHKIWYSPRMAVNYSSAQKMVTQVKLNGFIITQNTLKKLLFAGEDEGVNKMLT